ncbi:MAG: hypothetical protein HYZ53_30890 [Planctomycetes bacterium]|nr:hypothetical protein [Planctomycetota bacterium]
MNQGGGPTRGQGGKRSRTGGVRKERRLARGLEADGAAARPGSLGWPATPTSALEGVFLPDDWREAARVVLTVARREVGKVWCVQYTLGLHGRGLTEALRLPAYSASEFSLLGASRCLGASRPLIAIPLEVAQQLVWGGLEAARRRGVPPSEDIAALCGFVGPALPQAELDPTYYPAPAPTHTPHLAPPATSSAPSLEPAVAVPRPAASGAAEPSAQAYLPVPGASEFAPVPPQAAPSAPATAPAPPPGRLDPAEVPAVPHDEALYTEVRSIREFAQAGGGRVEKWRRGQSARLFMPEPLEEDAALLVAYPGKPLPAMASSCSYAHADLPWVAAALREWMSLETLDETRDLVRLRWVRGDAGRPADPDARWESTREALGELTLTPDTLTVECGGREDLYTARVWIENAIPGLAPRVLQPAG